MRSRLEIVIAAAASFAALLASSGAFRPVRDALIIGGNPENLPWIFIASFVAVSIASPAWSALLARRPPRRYVARTFHVFAACLIGFALARTTDLSAVAISRVFYVWAAVFNFFVVSVFWSLLADLLGPETARKVYGPIAAGGTGGAILGPLLSGRLVGTIGVTGVLVMSALLLELAVVGVWFLRRAAARTPPELRDPTVAAGERDVLSGGGALSGVARVVRSRFLASIVGYVLCTAFAATFLYLAQARILHGAQLDDVGRARYLADVELWTQVGALVLQLLVARPLLRWLNPGIVLAVLPLVQAIGLTALAAAPSLGVLAVALGISRAATHGLTRPARELLFTVVSRDDKYRAKNAIDTIGYRFGDVAAGWLNKGLTALSTGAVAIATFPLVAIWLGLAAALGLGFRRRLHALSRTAAR